MFTVQRIATLGLAIGAMVAGLVLLQPSAQAMEIPENWSGGLQAYGWDSSPYSRGDRNDLVCTSNHYRTQTCRLPRGINSQIKLVRKISKSACVLGQSWGVGERSVWVSDGCRAVFRVGGRGGNSGDGGEGNPYHHSRKGHLSCGSPHGEYRTCHLRHANRRHVRLARQNSGSPCVRDVTWGVKANKIWVNKGCRGVFRFSGKRPHYLAPSEY